jgi:hypothetical protein
LGERLLCKQEVIGSIPFTSTMGASPFGTSATGVWRRNQGVAGQSATRLLFEA